MSLTPLIVKTIERIHGKETEINISKIAKEASIEWRTAKKYLEELCTLKVVGKNKHNKYFLKDHDLRSILRDEHARLEMEYDKPLIKEDIELYVCPVSNTIKGRLRAKVCELQL